MGFKNWGSVIFLGQVINDRLARLDLKGLVNKTGLARSVGKSGVKRPDLIKKAELGKLGKGDKGRKKANPKTLRFWTNGTSRLKRGPASRALAKK